MVALGHELALELGLLALATLEFAPRDQAGPEVNDACLAVQGKLHAGLDAVDAVLDADHGRNAQGT